MVACMGILVKRIRDVVVVQLMIRCDVGVVLLSEAWEDRQASRRSRSIPTPVPNAGGHFFCCDIHHSRLIPNSRIMP